ncbi:LOW QUALITY PROTEIN: uncharacterized protein PS065_011545 [Dugong dugon]
MPGVSLPPRLPALWRRQRLGGAGLLGTGRGGCAGPRAGGRRPRGSRRVASPPGRARYWTPPPRLTRGAVDGSAEEEEAEGGAKVGRTAGPDARAAPRESSRAQESLRALPAGCLGGREERGELCLQPQGPVGRSGARWSGGPCSCCPARGWDLRQGPELPPAPPTPTESLGRAWPEADVVDQISLRGLLSASRSAREAGCPGKPAPDPSRAPCPWQERSPAAVGAPRFTVDALGGQSRGAQCLGPAPLHPQGCPFYPPQEELGWEAPLRGQTLGARRGVPPGLGVRGSRERRGCVGMVVGERSLSPPPFPRWGSGPAGGVRRPGSATLRRRRFVCIQIPGAGGGENPVGPGTGSWQEPFVLGCAGPQRLYLWTRHWRAGAMAIHPDALPGSGSPGRHSRAGKVRQTRGSAGAGPFAARPSWSKRSTLLPPPHLHLTVTLPPACKHSPEEDP